ncbi:MAG: hypothetical protein QG573_2824 [Acidobacteriota bacterium]|nr:hypothetical protein [Acidobacteriota bacterium]
MAIHSVLVATLLAMLGSAAARAQVDGTLDPSFAGGGATRIAFDRPGTNFRDYATALAIQPDGRLVVVGSAQETVAGSNVAVVRLNGDGAIDPSFGSGPFTFGFADNDWATDVLVEPSGSILVAVVRQNGSANEYSVYRWSATGTFEASVGLGPGTGVGPMMSLARDPISGKVLVAWNVFDGQNAAIRVVRLEQDLSLDLGYGPGGSRDIEAAGGLPTYLADMEVMPDGRLVLAARASVPAGGQDFLIARLTSAGPPDSTFGSQGLSLIPIDLVLNGSDEPVALALDALGRILVCGSAEEAQFSDAAAVLIRVDSNGAVDPGWNGGETLVVANTSGTDSMNGVAVQSDGKIVVAGRVNDPSPQFFAARFGPEGAADWSFGAFGVFRQDFPGSPDLDFPFALALQGGRPILAGVAEWSAPNYDFGLMRLGSSLIFTDGFARGTTGAWSAALP